MRDSPHAPELFPERLRWLDPKGCPVRFDVLATEDIQHCGWKRLLIRWPLGSVPPKGVRSGYIPASGSARLPTDAIDTGYRRGLTELWITRDAKKAFARDGNRTRRWNIETPPIYGCL